MTDEQIKELSREIAGKMYSQFANPDSVNMMAGEFEAALGLISETHCIVEKEKIRKFYRTVWRKSANKIQLELTDLFGKEWMNNESKRYTQ